MESDLASRYCSLAGTTAGLDLASPMQQMLVALGYPTSAQNLEAMGGKKSTEPK